MGNYSAAEPLLKRSLAIREKALGPEHPDVATSLNNLAELYRGTGNYTAAEPLYQRSLSISEKKLGSEHPDVATSLNNLAFFYIAMGNYTAAEPLYQRSLSILENALGPEHPQVAASLSNSAELNVKHGKDHSALSSMMRAQGIYERMIEQVSGFTSAERTMQFLTRIGGNVDAIASLAGSRMKEDQAACSQAFEVWLRRKGVVLEAQRRMQQTLLEAGDKEAAQIFEELSQIRSRLAQMTFAGPGKEGVEAYRKNLRELNDQREELDARLSRLSQPYAQARKAGKVTLEELAQALPPGTVLVDFARIEIFNFEAKGRDEKWMPARYLAFVLKPGRGQDVALFDLGPAEEVDNVLEQFKHALTQRQDSEARTLGRRLYDSVFAPVEKELSGVERVFISPDGALNLIPFELLRDPEGKFLIEKYTFNYLAAGRDLVSLGEKKANAGKPLLLGDPDFDLNPKQRAQAVDSVGARADDRAANAARSADLRSMSFKRLPGTRAEVSAIGDLLGRERCEVFLDNSALEEALQSRKAPRFLHLATHGFFLKDQEVAATSGFRSVVLDMDQPFAKPAGPRVAVENPLLRCGLALAGANRAGSVEQGSDGILTADEVLSLPLRGTELVVLSACETGLGEVKKGEGVYGLRRVFTQAGARSLVMSMWSVPDRETQELMVEFYRNAVSGKMDRCQALRQAALKQKEVVRQRYGQDHPYYWGAFVFLGQAD
jgi:CHAT domain-containing protein